MSHNFQLTTQIVLGECKTPHKYFETDITAHIPVGDIYAAHTSAKSATSSFQITSLSVGSVGFRLATGVGGIDCSLFKDFCLHPKDYTVG
jgi:hypothetical protein